MSIITMSMSEYTIEPDDFTTTGQPDMSQSSTQYSEEVLYAGWNPSLALQDYIYTETVRTSAMPRELAIADVDFFLDKMYAHQH